MATLTFCSVCDFMMGLGKPQPLANFEVDSFSIAEILKGNPKYLRTFLARGLAHFLLYVRFYDGTWQLPKKCTKFEVASFSHCVNIKGEPPNFGELP